MYDQKLMGVDIYSGNLRSSQKRAYYSIYLWNCSYDSEVSFSRISKQRLFYLIRHLKPDYIVIDDLGEVHWTGLQNQKFILITRGGKNRFLSLQHLLQLEGMKKNAKPNSTESASLFVRFAMRGYGAKYKLDGLTGEWKILETSNINVNKLEFKSLKTTNQILSQLKSDRFITKSQIIAKGKEAEIFITETHNHQNRILKIYYPYSNGVKKYSKTKKKRTRWDIPEKLARHEEKLLKFVNSENIPAPQVYQRNGPVLWLEPLFYRGRLAPTIRETDLRLLGNPMDYLYRSLNVFFDLFKRCHIFHRDFSVDNLLLTDDGVKVIDFTLATNMSTVSGEYRSELLKNIFSEIVNYFKSKYRLNFNAGEILISYL